MSVHLFALHASYLGDKMMRWRGPVVVIRSCGACASGGVDERVEALQHAQHLHRRPLAGAARGRDGASV
jgi:hypothetical protein